ncbi:MAG TPA: response regulator [Gemmatimonadales bacterium]|nr:response regulator [Gemmatimonadales bacterium]
MVTVEEVEVLLVEDNSSDAELTVRALKKNNLTNRLQIARDGVEALDFLFARGAFANRVGSQLPKVVLLDMKLPKMSGLEVLAAIRKDERTKVLPVVMLTSSKQEPDIQRCYALGVNSYIVKPVDFEAFAHAVTQAGLYWLLVNQPPTT